MKNFLFISYRDADEPRNFAFKLGATLKNEGLDAWIDKYDGNIRSGEEWLEKLEKALDECSGLICVLSHDYFNSRYCRMEVQLAFSKNKPIFPLLIQANPSFPNGFQFLKLLQWIDFTNWKDNEVYFQQVKKLCSDIRVRCQPGIGDISNNIERYLKNQFTKFKNYQGVTEYITLSGYKEAALPEPRISKQLAPGLRLLVDTHNRTPEYEYFNNIYKIAKKYPRFVLLGEAGSGKTTTIYSLALRDIRKKLKNTNASIPFLVDLSVWDEQSLEDFLQIEWAHRGMDGDISALLYSGEVYLYLDGLNEIGSKSSEKANLIRRWLKGATQPKYVVITCRTEDYTSILDISLPIVLIDELSDQDIQGFAIKYLGAKADDFLNRLFPTFEAASWKTEKARRHAIFHIARNPYLLTALITIYSSKGYLVNNVGILFQKLTEALWERELIRQPNVVVSLEELLNNLAQIAFDIINEDIAISIPETKIKNEEVLRKAIAANFIIRENGKIRFYHQLVQEYFAALALKEREIEDILFPPKLAVYPSVIHAGIWNDPYDNLLCNRNSSKWDKVIINLIGIAPNFIHKLIPIDPFLAAYAVSSGVNIDLTTRYRIFEGIISAINKTNCNGVDPLFIDYYVDILLNLGISEYIQSNSYDKESVAVREIMLDFEKRIK